MPSFSPGMLGYGMVINGVSIVLRPFHDGFRVHANHRPCKYFALWRLCPQHPRGTARDQALPDEDHRLCPQPGLIPVRRVSAPAVPSLALPAWHLPD